MHGFGKDGVQLGEKNKKSLKQDIRIDRRDFH